MTIVKVINIAWKVFLHFSAAAFYRIRRVIAWLHLPTKGFRASKKKLNGLENYKIIIKKNLWRELRYRKFYNPTDFETQNQRYYCG
jgi:hypothetical protein